MQDYLGIDINEICDDTSDPLTIIEQYKSIINESGYLKKGTFNGKHTNGKFDENLWVYENYNTKGNIFIDFEDLNELKFFGLTFTDIMLIKSWVAESICNHIYEYKDSAEFNISPRVKNEYSTLVIFLRKSKNFSAEFLQDVQGSLIEEFFQDDISNNSKKDKIDTILDYIFFIEDQFFNEKGEKLASAYIEKLQKIDSLISYEFNRRTMPSGKNVLLFDHYVKLFFSTNLYEPLKLYFFPILLWWKITTIIPMRISEFCLKIERNCLFKDDSGFYMKIGRLKKRPKRTCGLLPVINQIKITEEVYNLIQNYINETDQFGMTKTLISYPSIIYLRDVLNKTDLFENAYYTSNVINGTEYFTSTIFSSLLKSYYSLIIKKMYNDTLITELITPNQTRHLAFTALLLQGYSPVEIAILGGHRSLKTLDSYTSSYNSYIDNEVRIMISNNASEDVINRTNIKRTIFSKPVICPGKIDDSMITEIDGIKLGYCTCNFKNGFNCKDEDCYNCDDWWCEPSRTNYDILLAILNRRLTNHTSKLERNIDFIKKLFSLVIPSNVEGNLYFDKTDINELKNISMTIQADCKELIDLKSQLIDPNMDLFDQLEVINLITGEKNG